MASAKEFLAKHGLAIGTPSTIVFNSSGVLQASALSGATISITSVDIDGGTDIGADLVDADLLLVDDGAGGTNRKSALSRVKKYIYSAVSGDATVSDTGALTIAATSVENSMLAGSIANSKLTNSTITVTDGSNSTATALGGTITFAGTANETTVTESSGTVTIGLPDNVTLASNLNVGKNVVISGNLTVSGTQTVIDTNTVNIGDNIITLNSDETGTPSQNAGIEVERGSATNVVLRWNETSDKWQITNDGSSYQNLGESELVNDTSPQLGGALDLNSNNITGTGNINITGTSTISGLSSLSGAQFDGNVTPSSGQGVEIFAPDTSTGQIQSFDRTNSNFDKLIIKGDPVEIYDGSTKRIETTNSGVDVTGTVEFDGLSGTGSVTVTDILDEDAMGSNSATALATQQSIKAYVDANAGASVSNGSNDRILTSTGGNGINAESDFQFDGTNVFIPNEIRHIGDPDTKLGFTTDTITLTAGGVAIQTLTTSGTSTSALTVTGATNLGTVQAETLAIENPASHHTYTVTVASKTSAHPYTGQGSSSAYFLDGKESPSIILATNMTYRFDQADNTNSGHPLRFYLDAAKTTQYTTGVTNSGTPGSSGAYTQIVVTDATPPCLYYQCSAHGYMGSVANALGKGTTDHLTEGSTNLYYTDARVSAHLNTSSASSGQILGWNGSDFAWQADGGSLTVQDEGSALSTAATTLNFVGAGVTASGTGATKTITISGGGGGSSLSVKDEGSALSTAATTLNFVGAGVVASGTGAEKTITIAGGGSGITVQDEGSSLSTSGTTLNFVGAGVTASGTGATKTITISGGGGSGGSTNLGGQFTSGTGNGSATTFTSPINTNLANNLIVSVDGIMQRPTTDYTVSGTTVTFGTAPPSGTAVLVRSFSGAISSKADFTVQNFTANGSNTVYKLAETVSSGDHVLVSINGVIQRNTNDYTYNTGNGNITFDAAPTAGDIISFRTFDLQQSTSATVSDTAPTDPRNGDFWFDSSTAKLYMRYEDGSSNQWISLSATGADGTDGADGADGADGSATVYANTSVLPTSGNSVGDFAFATLTKSVHVWDGSEWDRINSGPDENPRLTTTPATTHALNADGTNTAITIVASDPEGFPITYSHDTNPASPNQVTNIVENNGVFTLVPSTNTAHAGNFTLRLKASDGVHITSHAIAVTLQFSQALAFSASGNSWGSDWDSDDNFFNNSESGFAVSGATNSSGAHQWDSDALRVGKYYFEVDFRGSNRSTSATSGGAFPGVGFVALYGNESSSASYGYNSTGYVGIYGSGALYVPTSSGSLSGPNGKVVHFAYDSATRKAWIGISNDGSSITWATAGGNPGSGGSGYSLGGSNGEAVKFSFGSGSGGGSGTFKGYIRTGDNLLATVPTGFTAH